MVDLSNHDGMVHPILGRKENFILKPRLLSAKNKKYYTQCSHTEIISRVATEAEMVYRVGNTLGPTIFLIVTSALSGDLGNAILSYADDNTSHDP